MSTVSMRAAAGQAAGQTHIRYLMLAVLFIATTVNYADRASLSMTGSAIQGDLGLDAATMGYVFSAFSWAYVLAQLPGGWLLDRFGSRRVYAVALFAWSTFTLLQGLTGALGWLSAAATLFLLRFLVGLSEAPVFPANSRIVAAWFPTAERGTAAAIFNSAQYFALVVFSPLMGFIIFHAGWRATFVIMALIGYAVGVVWLFTMNTPTRHRWVNDAEMAHLKAGNALVDMDGKRAEGEGPQWHHLKVLATNRMMVGVYLAQYCVNALTYFFLTWFPVYLVQQRGMSILDAGFVAALPALCGFLGGILGGVFSDYLLRRGVSLTAARKIPIVIGMLTSMSMIICNYVDADWIVVAIMALAFFGKGLGALGWAVISDTAPKESSGVCGGLFNAIGNAAGIVTPIVIGYLVASYDSFGPALVFVGIHGLVAVISYLFIVGRIERIHFDEPVDHESTGSEV